MSTRTILCEAADREDGCPCGRSPRGLHQRLSWKGDLRARYRYQQGRVFDASGADQPCLRLRVALAERLDSARLGGAFRS